MVSASHLYDVTATCAVYGGLT